MSDSNDKEKKRAPIISVMGHIDHGKSTLLDYIRETNVADSEAGGITQHTSAYEITHAGESGQTPMTFLDTPGHKAFISMRQRGASIADIAVLVVAADQGVQAQTVETINALQDAGIPYIVAFNKIDKEMADVDGCIEELAEQEVYVEGFGGDISYEEVSAKTGTGVSELLDLLALNADILELTYNPDTLASGVVLESSVDAARGTQATLLLTDGRLKAGQYVQSGKAVSPTRIVENFQGTSIESADASTPVKVVGFDTQPQVGAEFQAYETKESAKKQAEKLTQEPNRNRSTDGGFVIPVIVKTDVSGTADAVVHELKKLETEQVSLDIIDEAVGNISESDVRSVAHDDISSLAIGFNVDCNQAARREAKRRGVEIKCAPVIYELIEWAKTAIEDRRPTVTERSIVGRARILKTFSAKKDAQVLGGEVLKGKIVADGDLTIYRNEMEIADGDILELQQQRSDTKSVTAGQNFGINIESNVEIAPGDIIESYEIVEK